MFAFCSALSFSYGHLFGHVVAYWVALPPVYLGSFDSFCLLNMRFLLEHFPLLPSEKSQGATLATEDFLEDGCNPITWAELSLSTHSTANRTDMA